MSVSTIRNLEPHLQSELIDDAAHISWSTGPRAGEQFEVVNIDDCDFSELPTVDQLEQDIADEFDGVEITNFSSQQFSTYGAIIDSAVGRAYSRLYRAYYGDGEKHGLEYARLFDLDGEGAKYNELINDIVSSGRRDYLCRLATRFGINGLQLSYSDASVGCNEIINNFFKGYGDNEEYLSMALAHETITDTTPTVIELGALVADKVRSEAGVPRVSGETKGNKAHEPDHIFFWPKANASGSTNPFTRGFDPSASLELPAVWGIENTEPLENAGLVIEGGHWCSEKKVLGGVPLELFTHLWVPPIAVLRQSKLLSDHGFGHIKVSPFPARLY